MSHDEVRSSRLIVECMVGLSWTRVWHITDLWYVCYRRLSDVAPQSNTFVFRVKCYTEYGLAHFSDPEIPNYRSGEVPEEELESLEPVFLF